MKGAGLLILLFCTLLVMATCKKEEPGPADNGIPYIELQEVSPVNVKEFRDSIIFRFFYADSDGNLGHENADSFSLQLHDSRLNNPDWFYVPPLAPIGETLNIQGILKIVLASTFLLGNGASDTITYNLRLKDRAGNWSNTITTPPITINR